MTDGATVPARAAIALAALLALLAVYYRSQVPGLRSAAAMEHAQLARNISDGLGFTTRCVRPLDTWYLRKNGRPACALESFPETRNAPLYPLILSAGLRVIRPPHKMVRSALHRRLRVFAPEQRVLIPMTILFTIGTVVLVFFLGMRLVDYRAGLCAAAAYVVSDAVLAGAVSGTATPAAAFFTTLAIFLALQHRPDNSSHKSIPLIATGVACGLAFLTRYAAIAVLPACGLALFVRSEKQRWIKLFILLLVVVAVAAPWLARNLSVTGGMFGTAPYSVLNNSPDYPDDTLARDPGPQPNNVKTARAVKAKLISGCRRLLESDLRTLGSGVLICFFLVSLFTRSNRFEVDALKWATAVGLGSLLVIAAVTDQNSSGILNIFLPVLTLCAVAFFFDLTGSTEDFDAEWQTVLTFAFVLIAAVPAICAIAGAARRSPYPPYHPPFVSYVCDLLEPDETVCTDIPWATAWYGKRNSLLLPRTLEDFKELHHTSTPVSAIYLTTRTSDRKYSTDLRDGAHKSWLPLLNEQVPPDFPFKHGIALPPGRHDQLFLTDRPRWEEETTGQQDNGSTGQQDNGTTGPQDNGTTGPQDNGTTGPRDHRTTGPQDHRTTGAQDHRTTGAPRSGGAGGLPQA